MNPIQEKRLVINDLDNKIFELFRQRFEISDEIGKIKINNSVPIQHDSRREQEIISKLQESYPSISKDFIESIYHSVFDYAIRRQNNLG